MPAGTGRLSASLSVQEVLKVKRCGTSAVWPAPGSPGAGPLDLAVLTRAEVQDHNLIGAGAGAGVGACRLSGLERVLLGWPADEVLRVVLEPLRRRRDRNHRQVLGDVGLDRGKVSGLLCHARVSGQLGKQPVQLRVLETLVVAGVGLAVVKSTVQPVVIQVEWRQAVVRPVLAD